MEDHLHAEPVVSALRHRAGDPAHPDQAQRLARHLRAEHVGGSPAGPLAAAQVALALAGPPRRHQQQRDGEVGGGVGQDVGCIGDRDPARLRGVDVDVVEPDPEVRDQPGPPRLDRQHVGRHLVGDGREQRIGVPQRVPEAVRRERPVLGVEAGIELPRERLVHRLGQPPGDDHDGTGSHVRTGTRFDMPPSTFAAVDPRSAGLGTTVMPASFMISTFSAALSPNARMIAPA